MNALLNPTFCSWIRFLSDQLPVCFTVWLQTQLSWLAQPDCCCWRNHCPGLPEHRMGFGCLGGDLCMLVLSTRVLWIPELTKLSPEHNCKTGSGKDFVANAVCWMRSACTMGVRVAGRARVGAWGGNDHGLLSQLLSFAGALLWLLLRYSGLGSKDCFYNAL